MAWWDRRLAGLGAVAAAQVLALTACQGAPTVGSTCGDTRGYSCDEPRGVFACVQGLWVSIPCEGPSGCTGSGASLQCDTSVATAGALCPPWRAGRLVCRAEPSAVLECREGRWAIASHCGACAVRDGAAQCTEPAACGPSTCDGCCHDGGCVLPPDSQATGRCGKGGLACDDCGARGEVCGTDTACRTAGTSDGGCAGVPTTGRCLTATSVEYCAVLTGSSTPSVQTYTCGTGSTCTTSTRGARCVSGGACLDGQSRCQGPALLETCSEAGAWTSTPCATGCRDSALGGFCPAPGETRALEGRILYMTREPNGVRPTNWAAATAAPARGVAVISQLADGGWLDAVTSDADGGFSVRVAAGPAAGDGVHFAAFGGDGLDLTYALIKPNLAAGSYTPFQTVGRPEFWHWARSTASLVSAGRPTVTVSETEGSAALNLYDVMHRAYARNRALHQGTYGSRVALWFQLGVAWSCGACFGDVPGYNFDSHTFLSGDSASLSYWSDPVAAHELGHWAMASWSTNPGEGGDHYLGIPTFPGMAWSEGWATFHASDLLGSPVYFDRSEDGVMFWVDLSTRTSTDGELPQSSARADGGLQQRIDENEVASMLWDLTAREPLYVQQVHNALASPHMRDGPWPRGYFRHTWSVDPRTGQPYDVQRTSDPASFVADFFDALVCQGVPPAAVDAATAPAVRFPYPSSAPLCQRATRCYGCLSGGTCQPGDSASACGTGAAPCATCPAAQSCRHGACRPKPRFPIAVRWLEDERTQGHAKLRLRVEHRAAVPLSLTVRFEAPDGASLEPGLTHHVVLPPSSGPAVHLEPVTVRYERLPGAGRNLRAIVEGTNGRMGFSGEVSYRFGRRGEALEHTPVQARGPGLLRHGRSLGAAVLLPADAVATDPAGGPPPSGPPFGSRTTRTGE